MLRNSHIIFYTVPNYKLLYFDQIFGKNTLNMQNKILHTQSQYLEMHFHVT